MANSYTQIYIHYIFAAKGRKNFLLPENNDELHKYITGIVQNRKCKMLQINSVPDHLHMLVGLHPTYAVSKLIQEVKAISSGFINDKKWTGVEFHWQEGYGAFSYSRSQIDNVIKYILNQQEHHKKRTFREEYLDFLEKFEVEYDERYLFEFYD
ncbi:MAG: IS200/IS605 family transposase [Bacteroidales bacterium]|nr:IS200/IS605 family transposase [Bacteroidales bacterium]